ncbi:hypothetical protein KDK95_21850 [Actinospica sp. MGRD01-02]|uniref:Uncharacterized protein n=1 Tax=Actinospica acidithermotolerans TaxID=2828514 RepID=A0A941EH44_9ACTN|nr:hypothetical protein [Actinospica acidithermotolerans]MBR7828969.1 hypothetical protein [Actinospica acidithermotolerans]
MSERRGTGPDGQGGKKRAAARGKPPGASGKPVTKAAGSSAKPDTPQQPEDRNLRRAVFLAELAEAKELRKRVAPRKTRNAELHARLLRTFRY